MLRLEETNKRKDKIGNSQYTIAMFAKCQLVSLLELFLFLCLEDKAHILFVCLFACLQ